MQDGAAGFYNARELGKVGGDGTHIGMGLGHTMDTSEFASASADSGSHINGGQPWGQSNYGMQGERHGSWPRQPHQPQKEGEQQLEAQHNLSQGRKADHKRLRRRGENWSQSERPYDHHHRDFRSSKNARKRRKKRRRRKRHHAEQEQHRQKERLENQQLPAPMHQPQQLEQQQLQSPLPHAGYAHNPSQPTSQPPVYQNGNGLAPGAVCITISSKLAPGQKMRMIVQRGSYTDHAGIDATGVQWESFLSGVRDRLGLSPERRIRVYDANNAEIRSIEDLMNGDDLVVVPSSEREHEIAFMQHPAPHPQHHKIASSFINGPNGVGLTTFFNSRKQVTDAPSGVKRVPVPSWEKDSRMTPQERRHMEHDAEQKRNMIGIEANFARGGEGRQHILQWSRTEGDKCRGVKRHPCVAVARSVA